ncbi:polarity establishment/cellular polarization [Tilletia horrida]|nr:polarity establishment/cellular polarization [Tilletia horrida]
MRPQRRSGNGMRRWAVLIPILVALSGVAADVSVERRLSTQLPQLGHVGLPYSWTFASDTFVDEGHEQSGFGSGSDSEAGSGSDSGSDSSAALSFKVQGLPSWATFDAASRTFSGSPGSQDEGKSTVTVVARGSHGSTVKDTFSLVVVEAPPPMLKLPLAPQLPHINGLGPQYILPDGSQFVPLGWSFSLGFDGNSFQLPNWEQVYYTATRDDGSPLPSWLTFSAETFTFDGVAPASPTPDDSAFTVVITASNIRGYGGTTDSFRIVLTKQALSLAHPLRTVNATAGTSFRYTIPTTGVQLNGKQAPQDDTITVDASISPSYPWLSWDPSSASLSGTPPLNFSNSDADPSQPQVVAVPVLFSDKTNNTMNTTLSLNVYPSVFTLDTWPNVEADPGMPFNLSLQSFVRGAVDASAVQVNLTYDPAEASKWFVFNASTLFLSGRTPADAVLDKVKIKVDASSDVSDEYARGGSATFYVNLSGGELDPSGSSQNDNHHQDSNGMTDRTRTALGASLGTVGGVLLLFLLILGCRRFVAEEEHDHEIYTHKDLGSFDTMVGEGKSPALSGKYIPHSQLQMSKGYNASQVKFKSSPYLEPTSILVAPVLSAGVRGNNNGGVAWADGQHYQQGGAALEQVVVGDAGGSPTLNEAVAAYRQAEAVAMSNAAQRERPKPHSLLAAIFSAKKPRLSHKSEVGVITHGPYVASNSAGLGLSGLGIGEDGDVHSLDGGEPGGAAGAGRMSHSRSRHTIQSRKSSWEEGIWHDGDPRAAGSGGGRDDLQRRDDLLASPESGRSQTSSAPSIPQRRGGGNLLFGNHKSGLGPMRHRNGHINDSPAFQTTGTFDTTTSSGGMPLSESRQRMYDEARNGLEQRVLSAGNVLTGASAGASSSAAASAAETASVRQLGIRHPISIEESKLRSVSHAVSSEGAFEDADEDITSAGMHGRSSRGASGHHGGSGLYDDDEDEDDVLSDELSTAEIVAAGRALTTESATAALSSHAAAAAAHRQSVLSYITNHEGDRAVQGAAIFVSDQQSALKTVPTFSLRPEETMRAVGDVKTIRY